MVRAVLVTMLLSLVAAAIGGWAGVRLGLVQEGPPAGLHQIVHRDLQLDPAQQVAIERLETDFARRRTGWEADMRAANAELAAAIASEHAETPRVQAAIDRFHAAMGALQKATVAHVLAMRAVLKPQQTERFDREVEKALTSGRR